MNVLDPLAISVLLVVIGCLLILAEVFIPSGGVLGMLAVAAFLGAVGYSFYHRGVFVGATFLAVSVVLVPTMVALALEVWPRTPMGRAFLGELPEASAVAPNDPRRQLVGKVGIARSKMLPSGAVEIEGEIYDAVSQGMAIDPGDPITVMEVRGNQVIVRPTGEGEIPNSEPGSDPLSRPVTDFGIDGLDEPLS